MGQTQRLDFYRSNQFEVGAERWQFGADPWDERPQAGICNGFVLGDIEGGEVDERGQACISDGIVVSQFKRGEMDEV